MSLGGAKHIASAVSKGAKVATTVANKASPLFQFASTKGGQVLAEAMKRLENIPIFIPGAAGGAGGFVKAGNVIKSVSQRNAQILEAAMFAEANFLKKKLTKLATDHTHHIVAQAAEKTRVARDILAKFGINIKHQANGVLDPLSSRKI